MFEAGGGAGGGAPRWYLKLTSSLYIATFSVRVAFAMLYVALPKYLGDDIGYLEYALVLSTWPLVEMVMVLRAGEVIDRTGRKATLTRNSLLAAALLALLGIADHPVWVAVVNGFMGIAAAGILVASLALMSDYAPHGKRGREMGVFQFVQIFGWLFGFAAGGVLVEVLDQVLGAVFALSALLCLVAAVYAWRNVTEPRVHRFTSDHEGWSHLLRVVRQRSVVLLVMPWFVVYLLIGSMFTFVFKASFEELQLTGFQLTGLLVMGGGVILATLVVFDHLSDRFGRVPVMAVGAVGMLCLMVTVGMLISTAPGDGDQDQLSEHLGAYLVPLAVSAFLAGAFAPSALAALVDVSAQRRKGMTMGVYSFAISLAMAVGPVVSGGLIDTWGGRGYLAFLAGCGAMVLLLVALRWSDARGEAPLPDGPRLDKP